MCYCLIAISIVTRNEIHKIGSIKKKNLTNKRILYLAQKHIYVINSIIIIETVLFFFTQYQISLH